ncbi:MAG: hypothetical protein HC916_21945 [Coleofasciculaceae cyanobacterium SM2_1_6]|nr:hypothetical protein [Coleofasciculaceae cyanobacterium SM2_1_6]
MVQTLTLCDEYGVIYQAIRILPNDQLKIDFLTALAELEDIDGQIHLKDIIEGQKHDNVLEVIKSKKSRYQ